jgi:hypothetical protein
MCFFKPTGQTVEEIVAAHSAGMTDHERAQYWYELSQNIFALLGKIDITLLTIPLQDWIDTAIAQYPTLADIKFADSTFYTVNLADLQKILNRDWSNLVPYVAETSDCDKFATRLYSHLCDYYKINSIVPVWGETTQGYHGFNLAVVQNEGIWVARLIEPQTDAIFVDQGPLGKYTPRSVAEELGIKKIPV